MAILVGIDEAGYGPALGPLVIGATVWHVPDDLADEDLWEVCRHGVARAGRAARGRVTIADSKLVHAGDDKFRRLELNLLATCPLALPAVWDDVVAWLDADPLTLADREPWHAGAFPAVPLEADPAEITALGQKFRRAAEREGVTLRAIYVNVAQPWRLNRMIAATDNKAAALWSLSAELLEKAIDRFGDQMMTATMDKQGGRAYYGRLIQQTFPLLGVEVVRETPSDSQYLLDAGAEGVRIRLLEKADASSLPVSLASMAAKYVREVFMAQFNRWWRDHGATGVAPTAGYWPDYRRWADQMQDHLALLDLPEEHYIRSR